MAPPVRLGIMEQLTADELGEINLVVRDLMTSRFDRFEHPERRPEGAPALFAPLFGMDIDRPTRTCRQCFEQAARPRRRIA